MTNEMPSMAALEQLPGYWRGRRRVRMEMVVDDGGNPDHAKLAAWYKQRISFLEREHDR